MKCMYRNIFGAPGEGVHRFRLFNLAIVDVIFTIIGGYVISLNTKYSFLMSTIGLFILGILFHALFCVDTTVSKVMATITSKVKKII